MYASTHKQNTKTYKHTDVQQHSSSPSSKQAVRRFVRAFYKRLAPKAPLGSLFKGFVVERGSI